MHNAVLRTNNQAEQNNTQCRFYLKLVPKGGQCQTGEPPPPFGAATVQVLMQEVYDAK